MLVVVNKLSVPLCETTRDSENVSSRTEIDGMEIAEDDFVAGSCEHQH